MRYPILIFSAAIALLSGCSTDEPTPPVEQPVTPENVYLELNKWMYREMNRQYLWRNDLPDSTDCNYDLAPNEFFKSLLSDKDRFSYLTGNPGYKPGKTSESCGFAYQKYIDRNGNEALGVLYVTSADAAAAGIRRGDWLSPLSASPDCRKFAHMILDNGIFRSTGQTTEYGISDPDNEKRTVLLDTIYSPVPDLRIGYMCYLEFSGKADLYAPLRAFHSGDITHLILDLRYNPGGYVSTCRYLCNCIAPATAYEGVFQKCSYNDILSAQYLKDTGSPLTFDYFKTPSGGDSNLSDPIIPLGMKRLYVLTSSHTASASEATIVCLKPYMEVIVIGETTVGKGVGSWNISDSRFRYSIQPITMRYYNAYGISTPDSGIIPDYEVSGAFIAHSAIGDTSEDLLHKALSLIAPDIYTMPSLRPALPDPGTPVKAVGLPSFVTDNYRYNEDY